MSASSTQAAGDQAADSEGYPQAFGKYVLLRSKARGGMGELFVALAGETDGFEKLCVVKKVLHNLEDAGVHRRFLDEAKVVVRLNHTNLVQVFDAGRVDAEYYLAMELVEGKDLRAVWNRCAQLHRRIPVDFAIFVMREVARGLDYVHDAKGLELVHRDISPPNILIGYHGEIKLTDFGLAKSAIKREMTRPGVVFGRYSYLSPEQARGLPADRRTDIYAAGIVLWELLTGRQLFPSSNRSHKEALAAVRNPVVKAPSKVVPGIPPGLDDIVLRALTKDRDDRYASAGEFRTDLSDVLNNHFPTCDADRVSDFMRDIFGREYKLERQEYAGYLKRDFSKVRQRAENTQTISISDVILMSGHSGPDLTDEVEPEEPSGTIELADGDIVELDELAGGGRDLDSRSLRAQAKAWVGKVVAQRYRADALIGVGGMGAVFSATHLALGKSFALKILHRMYTRSSDVITRFLREARAASQTGHPNIVDVIDVGTTGDGDVYIAMELLEGQNLSAAVSRSGPLAVRRAVHIARQMCRALSAAHEAGIIHRDLKSENIFLTTRGNDPDFVKVLDFGICKQTDAGPSDTTPGIVLGSPDYMSPEQAAGKEATPSSDIYAVGVILYEMLTGALPFEGDSPVEVLQLKTTEDAPRVTDKRPEVPTALVDVVDQCLQRRTGERPPSMRVLEYELTRAVDGRASAVAAVLGLNVPGDEPGAGQSGGASRSGTLAAAAANAVGPADLADADSFDDLPTTSVPRDRSPAPARRPSALASGFKALMFVVLGGLLAAVAVAAVSPDLVDRVTGKTQPASEEPRPTPEPEPVAPPPVAPTPTPAVVPAPAPPGQVPPAQIPGVPGPDGVVAGEAPQAGELSVVARVERANTAFTDNHWREPPEASLALELTNIALMDPGNEAIARLREQAAAVLLPLAESAMAKKRWMEAVTAYRDLWAVWPEHVEAREQLFEALRRQGRVLARLKDHEGALRSADELLNLVPGEFNALMMRANALMALERWAQARDTFAEARKVKRTSKAAKKGYRKASVKARKAEADQEK